MFFLSELPVNLVVFNPITISLTITNIICVLDFNLINNKYQQYDEHVNITVSLTEKK